MYNKVIMAGNLTKDITLRFLPNGSAVSSTSLAANRKYTTPSGEKKEEVCFIDIAFFGRSAEVANQYLKRGSKVLVEGRLSFDQWTDQNGAKHSKHSIVVETMQMLDSKGDYSHDDKAIPTPPASIPIAPPEQKMTFDPLIESGIDPF